MDWLYFTTNTIPFAALHIQTTHYTAYNSKQIISTTTINGLGHNWPICAFQKLTTMAEFDLDDQNSLKRTDTTKQFTCWELKELRSGYHSPGMTRQTKRPRLRQLPDLHHKVMLLQIQELLTSGKKKKRLLSNFACNWPIHFSVWLLTIAVMVGKLRKCLVPHSTLTLTGTWEQPPNTLLLGLAR